MPVANRENRARSNRSTGTRQLVILAFASIGGLAAMWFLFSRATDLASSGEVDVQLGSSVFQAGNVERLSEDIEDKGPLFLGDLVGRDRDLYLQHVGDDPEEGWYAFGARPIDAPRDCYVEWQADERTFVDVCDATTYNETGEGLPQYPVVIDDEGELSIDVNAAERSVVVDGDRDSS